MRTDIYQSPLCERYASKEMQSIFSNDRKFSTWRKLWIALAESEKELEILLDPVKFTGMAEYQCEKYISDTVKPFLAQEQREEIEAQVNV